MSRPPSGASEAVECAFSDLASQIGRTLEHIRRDGHLTVQELADRANVPEGVVRRILAGTRNSDLRTIASLFEGAGYQLDLSPIRSRGRRLTG